MFTVFVGEEYLEIEVESNLVAAVNIGSYRVPVQHGQTSINLEFEFKSETDAEVVADKIAAETSEVEQVEAPTELVEEEVTDENPFEVEETSSEEE